MNRHCQPAPARGFTLVELMVTVAVLMIVLMIAAPSLVTMVAKNKLATQVNDFVATINLARSMAVTGKGAATVCSNNAGTCGTATDWVNGALVFVDTNASRTINSSERVSRRLDATTPITVTSNVAAISFLPDGTATWAEDDSTSRWVFCDPSLRAEPRIVSVQATGSNNLYTSTNCSL